MFVAYHGDPAIKAKYLDRVAEHRRLDEIAHGIYYSTRGGILRACAVGCTIHGDDHGKYETELGIPREIAHLEDAIFEGLPIEDARDWPHRFLDAIRPGADLSRVPHAFCAWLLEDEVPRHFDAERWPKVAGCVASIAALHRRAAMGEPVEDEEWLAASTGAAAAAANDELVAGAGATAYSMWSALESSMRSGLATWGPAARWATRAARMATYAAGYPDVSLFSAGRIASYRRMAARLVGLLAAA